MHVPPLGRWLATALTLLAVLVLGLHEAANPMGAVLRNAVPLPMQVGLALPAALDHDDANRGPLKHLGAVRQSFWACCDALRAPKVVATARLPAAEFGDPARASALSSLDPGGPRRPPRSSVIA